MKNRVVHNAGWIIMGRIAQMIISLFVGILSARYLGPGNYGLLNYAGAYTAFFTSICTLGINSVIVKEFIEHSDEQGEALGSALGLRMVSSFVSLLTIIAIVCIVDSGDKTAIYVTALYSISLLFQVFDTINYWFQAQLKSKVTSIIMLAAYTVTSAYRIILLALGKSVLWFAFAVSVDAIVVAVLNLIAYKKHGGQKLVFTLSKSKAILGKSYHYILSAAMIAIYGQTDKFMLKLMLNETEVGYYSTATTICNIWVFLLAAIIDSMTPTIIEAHSNGDYRTFDKRNRQLYAIVFYVSGIVSTFFVLFGGKVIGILYGSQYLKAAAPLSIITWYTAFSYLGVARNAWIVCENKQKYLKYMYFTAAVFNVVLNYFLIPTYGASGAAFASLLTQIGTSMVIPLFFKGMRPNVKLQAEAIILRGLK